MPRGLGYKRDLHDGRDLTYRLQLAAPIMNVVSHWRSIPRWCDQEATNSCVGHGVVGAWELVRALRGLQRLRFSRRHAYTNARLRSMLPGEPLVDEGTYIRDAMWALHALGISLEEHAPFIAELINADPGLKADVSGLQYADGEYRRIPGYGEQLLTGILEALQTGPVVIGKQVTRAFMNHRGEGVLPAPRVGEPYLGGHCTYLAGYREGGEHLFEMNSWDEWGFKWINTLADGTRVPLESGAWVSAEWVLSPAFGDAWAFVPKGEPDARAA